MNRALFFCDETMNFRSPAEPENGQDFLLRARMEKDYEAEVYLCTGSCKQQMQKKTTEGLFDYYEIECSGSDAPVLYYFMIKEEEDVFFFGKTGAAEESEEIVPFQMIPGFHVPEWSKGAVYYQIFVDRFRNGDPANDVRDEEYRYVQNMPSVQVKDWYTPLEKLDVHRFYGGDLQGVLDKLDYLQHLGVDVLYLNPIFVSPSNHKYDSQDYEHIDPHYGKIVVDEGTLLKEEDKDLISERYKVRTTRKENLEASDALFAQLTEEAHKRGIRVVVDGVFNHCGSFHKWMNRSEIYKAEDGYEPGAWDSKDSPYRDFFRFKEDGSYECWWGHDTLPKLNIDGCEELKNKILDIGAHWITKPMNADGWRLDVAADLGHSPENNHRFWQEFRRRVKSENPEAVIIAEHYGDVTPWLQGEEWDSVMNYDAFMEPLTYFLTGMEKHSKEYRAELDGNGKMFFDTMNYMMSRFPFASLQCALNQLDNHDHSRFITRTNRLCGRLGSRSSLDAAAGINKATYRLAVMMQMTWPGAPGLYYGDEIGLCGWTDPDNRRTYPWGNEDYQLLDYFKYAIRLHKYSRVFSEGSLMPLYAERAAVAYGRFLNDERVIVAVNNKDEEELMELNICMLGGEEVNEGVQVFKTDYSGYNVGRMPVPIKDGILRLGMASYEGVVIIV